MSTILVNKVQNLTGQTLTLDADFVNITGAVATFTGGSGVQVGVTAANEIDTTGGLNLILDSSGGTVQVDDNLTVTGTITTSVFQFGVSSSNEIDTLSGNLTLDSAGGAVSVDDDLSVTGSIATSVLQFGVTGSNEIDTVSGNLTIDSAGGTVTIDDDLTVSGNLTVNGTTTTVNSTTITIDDPIFTLGGDTAPVSDDNKDRGIEFRWHNGSTAKVGFFGFDDSTGHLTFIPDATNSSEVFSGTQGAIDVNEYYIGGTSVLNSTTLGSGVVTSSLTTVGTIGTGTWQGSTIGTAYGGTGQTSLGAVDAADFGSGSSLINYLLTSDGAGGAAWVAPSGVTDGDKGDIVVSSSGATWTIDNGVVGEDKITSALSGGGNATNTYVLTADGSGNVNWAAPSGGGGGITEAQAIAYAIAL